MAKDVPVIVMTILFFIMILGLMIFGVVEDAKHSVNQQARLDSDTTSVLTR